MKSRLILLTLLFWIAFSLPDSFAQNENVPTLWAAWENEVPPSMTVDYENVVKEQVAILKKHNYHRSFYIYKTDNNHYWWITPIADMADYDKGNQDWTKFVLIEKEEGFIFNMEFRGKTNFVKPMIFMLHPGLSYLPEKPNQTENNYFRWGFCYVKVGYEGAFQQNWKKWVNLFSDNNLEIGWNLYSGVVGTENPMYVWTEGYENPADMASRRAKAYQNISEQSDKLWDETMSYLRKIETITGWYRPDLSYVVED